MTYDLEPKTFFDGQRGGIKSVATYNFELDTQDAIDSESSLIETFVRTADGRGVAVVRQTHTEAWVLEEQCQDSRLRRMGGWKGSNRNVVILEGGKIAFAFVCMIV